MGVSSKYFNPKTYYNKVILLCCLVIADILFNSFTQFITYDSQYGTMQDGKLAFNIYSYCPNQDKYLSIALIVIQFILQAVVIFVLLSIFSETKYFKQGLMGVLCKNFSKELIFIIIYPVIALVERSIFFTKLNSKKNNNGTINDSILINIWSDILYDIFYIIKYIFAFLFYIISLKISFELGKSDYYRSIMLSPEDS